MNRTSKYAALALAVILMILSAAGCSSFDAENSPGGNAETEGIPEHRHEPDEKPVYDPDADCSIYIYMCGSNLESRRGLAGKDIDELLEADIPENVNVVLETGGAAKWHSHGIANDKLQRYIVKDHALVLVEELENRSMGDVNTFMDFLDWGRAEYPAERNLLIVWDHGGNATKGVCYDENFGLSGLKQSDFRYLRSRDEKADSYANEKKDMVIFDTCLMGNIETASWLQDYYHYMIASEVIVPDGGLNYKVIAEEFARNDDESFGRLVCDTFIEECRARNQENTAELSLFDLSKTDGLLNELEKLYADNISYLRKNIRAVNESEYGDAYFYSSAAEMDAAIEDGKSFNVVDIYNHAESVDRGRIENAEAVRKALQEMVIYHVGSVPVRPFPETEPENYRNLCNGISLYFPLVFDRAELSDYIRICPVEKYAEFLDTLYMHIPQVPLKFVNRGSLGADGLAEIQLTEDSAEYLKEVSGKVWKQRESDGKFILLGYQTVNISAIRDLKFTVPFTGEWYFLGGQMLYATVQQYRSRKYLDAPILLNGNYTVYHTSYSYDTDGKPVFEKGRVGLQYDANGLVQRALPFKPLKTGDLVSAVSEDSLEEAEPFTVDSEDITVEVQMLEPGTYRVQLIAVDINNNYIGSDYVLYHVSENGASVLGIEKYEE